MAFFSKKSWFFSVDNGFMLSLHFHLCFISILLEQHGMQPSVRCVCENRTSCPSLGTSEKIASMWSLTRQTLRVLVLCQVPGMQRELGDFQPRKEMRQDTQPAASNAGGAGRTQLRCKQTLPCFR